MNYLIYMVLVLFALRVYAMYGQSKALLVICSAFIAGRLAVDIWVDVLFDSVDRSL